MADESLLRMRILTQEWPHATAGVKRPASSLLAFLKEAQSGSLESAEKAYEKLMQEIQSYEFAITRLDVVAQRCMDEAREYRTMHADIDRSIIATTAKLDELKADLAAAKLERLRKQQYEEIARDINKRPTRATLQSSVDSVLEEIAAATAERSSLEARMALRKSQFQLLFSAIADLQRTFVEESEAEQRKTSAAAAAAAFEALGAAGAADVSLMPEAAAGDAGEEEGEGAHAGREAEGPQASEGSQAGPAAESPRASSPEASEGEGDEGIGGGSSGGPEAAAMAPGPAGESAAAEGEGSAAGDSPVDDGGGSGADAGSGGDGAAPSALPSESDGDVDMGDGFMAQAGYLEAAAQLGSHFNRREGEDDDLLDLTMGTGYGLKSRTRMMRACMDGDVARLRMALYHSSGALRERADEAIHALDHDKRSALTYAIEAECEGAVAMLIAAGADTMTAEPQELPQAVHTFTGPEHQQLLNSLIDATLNVYEPTMLCVALTVGLSEVCKMGSREADEGKREQLGAHASFIVDKIIHHRGAGGSIFAGLDVSAVPLEAVASGPWLALVDRLLAARANPFAARVDDDVDVEDDEAVVDALAEAALPLSTAAREGCPPVFTAILAAMQSRVQDGSARWMGGAEVGEVGMLAAIEHALKQSGKRHAAVAFGALTPALQARERAYALEITAALVAAHPRDFTQPCCGYDSAEPSTLALSAAQWHPELLRALLAAAPSDDARLELLGGDPRGGASSDKETALTLAAGARQAECVVAVLEALRGLTAPAAEEAEAGEPLPAAILDGALVRACTSTQPGLSPADRALLLACEPATTEIVSELLKAGASPNAAMHRRGSGRSDVYGCHRLTALGAAALWSPAATATLLLQRGADAWGASTPDASTPRETCSSALALAARGRNGAAFRMLLEAMRSSHPSPVVVGGAGAEPVEGTGDTHLFTQQLSSAVVGACRPPWARSQPAGFKRHEQQAVEDARAMVREVLAAGGGMTPAWPSALDRYRALQQAAAWSEALVRDLLAMGVSAATPVTPGDAGERLGRKHEAAADRWHAGRLDASSGEAPPEEASDSFSALHFAACNGNTPAVTALLAAGAPVNARDCLGNTPLHSASYGSHLDCVRELLAAGAHANAANRLGSTPLHLVALAGDQDGALSLAAIEQSQDIVAALLAAGAEVLLRNHRGQRAIDLREHLRGAVVDGVLAIWRLQEATERAEAAS